MWIELLLLCLLLTGLLYKYITKEWSFFDGQAICVSKPSFPFGSKVMKDTMMGKINFLEMMTGLAEEFPKEKIVGFFLFNAPRYYINDIELAKQILVKDFEYFTDRAAITTGDEIFNNFLLNLQGAEWKKIRVLMSGVFSSGKLKLMLPHINKAGANLVKHISKACDENEEMDMKNLGGLFNLDSIATAVFGIETNSFDDPENRFRMMALQLTNAPGHRKTSIAVLVLKTLMFKAAPEFSSKVLKMNFMDKESVDFFSDIIKRTYRQRMESATRRNDIIDLIVDEVKKSEQTNKGQSDQPQESEEFEDDFEKAAAMDTSDIKKTNVNEETVLVANALLFFFAGFDTTSTGFGAVSHKLVLYPEFQERVYEEIIEVLGDDKEVTFDKVNELKYMDKFISESMRHGNFVTFIERACTKNYKIPGTNVVVPKGFVLSLNIEEIHKDETNFYNAKEFDPENFDAANKPNKFAFQSFGQGPRNCIGMRYALLVLKVGLVHILRNFRIVRGSKPLSEVLRVNKEMNNFADGGVVAKFERRN